MKILVTGAAGFIAHAVIKRLLQMGHEIVGLDNINAYYDTSLKYARLEDLGISEHDIRDGKAIESRSFGQRFRFVKADITDRIRLMELFQEERFDSVINLAGQAGVRYSIENPYAYMECNVFGFLNILECCRRHPVQHLLFASSSSVYGEGNKPPYGEDCDTSHPVSLYAATKKSDELMAHAYSRLYAVPATALRFFTVYGPWGRPDMAPFIFMHRILHGEEIRVFNHGDMLRDFTFISDIVESVTRLLRLPPEGETPFEVYNIGHGEPVRLLDFIHTIETTTGRKARMRMEGMQKGDVSCTSADTRKLRERIGFRPGVALEEGIGEMYRWYKQHVEGQEI